MGKGYTGKILMVDLGNGTSQVETVPDSIYRGYLSGIGLGAQLLYNRIPAGADPLGPDNILGFMSGLLTGTSSFFTGRWMVAAKSPLTGGWGDANCGGTFSPALKRCGYDAIFFTGCSEKPVYLSVNKGKAELLDATDLWGADTVETEERLIRRHTRKKRPKVACIGPSGEKLSLISGVSNDGGRMAARSGLGAVMGAKKLKAVVLCGHKKIAVHDRKVMKKLSRKCNRWVQFQPPFLSGGQTAWLGILLRILPIQMAQDGLLYKFMLKKWGTVSMNQASIEMGDSPVKNWKGSNRDFGIKRSKTVNPDHFIADETRKYHCYACPLGCGGICNITGRYQKYKTTHKPEYETVLALGGLCLNEDRDSLFHLNELLNRAGMDTISAGGTVAFAIECFEKGLLTLEDTDGLELSWGDSETIVSLVEKMVAREGIGDLLADGVKKAAERIGKNADRYAVHAGGQELGMHDGRNDPGFALHYSVEPAPGRHTTGSYLFYEMFQLWKRVSSLPRPAFFFSKNSKYASGVDKATASVACSRFMSVMNGAGACKFAAFMGVQRFPIFEWLNAATGWGLSPDDYMAIGDRIHTTRQAFNVKHGIRPKDNLAAARSLGRPGQSDGANRGRTIPIEKLARDYWEQFGWDPRTGVPGPERLRDLGIEATNQPEPGM